MSEAVWARGWEWAARICEAFDFYKATHGLTDHQMDVRMSDPHSSIIEDTYELTKHWRDDKDAMMTSERKLICEQETTGYCSGGGYHETIRQPDGHISCLKCDREWRFLPLDDDSRSAAQEGGAE